MKKAIFALLVVTLFCGHATAALKYWDTNSTAAGAGATPSGNASGTSFWNAASNGTGALSTWTSGDTAVFSAGTDAINSFNVTLNSGITVAGVQVEEGTVNLLGPSAITIGTGAITIASGSTLSYDNSARFTVSSGASVTINGGTLRNAATGSGGSFISSNFTINLGTGGGTLSANGGAGIVDIESGLITGTGPLTIAGSGTFRLATTPATYTGATIINGRLQLSTTANVIPNGTDMTINSGGVFDVQASETIASLAGAGNVAFTGSPLLTLNGSTSTTFSGNFSGAGSVTKNGNSTLTLTGTNTHTGTTTISSTAGNVLSIGDGNTSGTISGNIATTANGALIFNRSDASNYAGVVSGAGTVTVKGGGTLSMTNATEWSNTGGVVITGATLKYGTSGTGLEGTVPVTINNGGTLDMNLANDSFGSLVSDAGNTTGVLSMNTKTLSLTQTVTTSRTYSGTITGSGALTKAGSTFTQTLAGNSSSYSGNILVTLGKVAVGHANALGSTSGNTQVTAGAELLFDGAANSFTIAEPIQIAGVGPDGGAIQVQNLSVMNFSGPVTMSADATLSVSGAGTATYSNAAAITGTNRNLTLQGGAPTTGNGGSISGVISLGTGGITKNQGGTWVLSGANLYSGNTVVNNGTLLVNNTSDSGTGTSTVTVNSPGTLGGKGTIGGNVALAGGTLAPGASIGTLNIGGSLGLTSGSFVFQFSNGGGLLADNAVVPGADLTNVVGALSITSAMALSATNLGNVFIPNGIKFTIIAYNNATTPGAPGQFNGKADHTGFLIGGREWVINYKDTTPGLNGGTGDRFVTITAVPEASSILVLGLGGVFAIGAVRLGKRYGLAFKI